MKTLCHPNCQGKLQALLSYGYRPYSKRSPQSHQGFRPSWALHALGFIFTPRIAYDAPMPVYRLTEDLVFPPAHHAEAGLLAMGGDLSEERLLLAYRSGIFPWYSEGEPVLWWSPDPRMMLFPGEFHCSRSLRRTVQAGTFNLTLDRAFPEVIRACRKTPRPRQDGTWITPAMEAAYSGLHESGHAHSIECWEGSVLAGGLYGVATGGLFFGESMFSHQPNASKVAMYALVQAALAWGIPFIDCQVPNPHLARLGARPVPRPVFFEHLRAGLHAELASGAWHTLPPFPGPVN